MVFGADIVRTYRTYDGGKDTWISFYSGGLGLGNAGGAGGVRLGTVSSTRYGLFDFGNEAAMAAQLLTDCQAKGFATVQDAVDAGRVTVTMTGMNRDSTVDKTVQVNAFSSKTAWVEGGGTDADDGVVSIGGVCKNYADWANDGLGTYTAWQQVAGVNLADINGLTLTTNSTLLTGFVNLQWQSVVLDPAVWQAYMYSTDAGPGIMTKAGGTGDGSTTRWYTKEQNGSQCPRLVVTVSDVPEPATMGLLLVGGIGALLKRRR